MIVPSDDDFLDVGAVVVRDDEPGQGEVTFDTARGDVVSVWWDEDARSTEIVWRARDTEMVRIEWSDVDQLRLTAMRSGGVQVALVIPATGPAAALTVQVDSSGVRIWSALPSSDAHHG